MAYDEIGATEVTMGLSSRQIQDKQFTTALRGYDREDVDRFMTECASHTSALEERTKIAEVRAETSERELAGLRAEIDVLLDEATEARRKIIEDARAEAGMITGQASAAGGSQELSDTASRAAAIISEAEATANRRIEGIEQARVAAEEEAVAIRRRAEESAAMTQAEADRLLDKARLDSNSIREEAEVTRVSMEAQLAEIRRLLHAARVGDAETDVWVGASMVDEDDSDLVIDLREDAKTPQSRQATG